MQAVSGYQDLAPGTVVREAAGTLIVAGRLGFAGAGTEVSRWSGFRVYEGAQFRRLAEWREFTGDAFFSTTGRLWALKADGTPRWTPAYRELTSPSTPLFAPQDAWVYVGAGDGLLHRFSVSSGEEDMIAPFPVDLSEGGAVGSPTFDLAAGFVYVGTEAGLVYAVRLP